MSNTTFTDEVVPDKLHPNSKGHSEYLALKIKREMLSLI